MRCAANRHVPITCFLTRCAINGASKVTSSRTAGPSADLHQGHGFVLTLEQAAALAVKAGTDLSCGPEFSALPFALRNRLLSNDDLDRAVKRLFEARFRLGMFDPPDRVPWSKLTAPTTDTPAHRQVALETARKSIVLLKNEHNTLPLKSSVNNNRGHRSNADSLSVLLGNYNGNPSRLHHDSRWPSQAVSQREDSHRDGISNHRNERRSPSSEYLRTGGANSQRGLNAEYFSNVGLSGTPVLKRVDAGVDFEWNNVPPGPAFLREIIPSAGPAN